LDIKNPYQQLMQMIRMESFILIRYAITHRRRYSLEDKTNPIDKITTIPNMPVMRRIRLPEEKPPPLVYAPININISKPAGIWLGIGVFLLLSVCTITNFCILLFKQIITVIVR